MKLISPALICAAVALSTTSCTKTPGNHPTPNPLNSNYYPLTTGSADSVNYATTYNYDASNHLVSYKTDSLSDSLVYNASNQIALRIVNHLKPSAIYHITLPRIDSVIFSYDNTNRIAGFLSPNETTGVTHISRAFVYGNNNQIIGDSSYALIGHKLTLTSYTTRAYDAAGNADTVAIHYLPKYYKVYVNGDSLKKVTTVFTYLANPGRNNVFDVNTRLAIGDLNRSPNVSSQRIVTGYKTDGSTEYVYTYTNTFTFDSVSLLPTSLTVSSSPAAAGSGPYKLTYTYKTVSK